MGRGPRDDAGFRAELDALLRDYAGRPTPLYLAERLSRGRRAARSTSSARTCCTPARTRSTTRSARRCWPSAWASTRIIAETGAGQHGVATATACALLGLRVRRLHGRRRTCAASAPNVAAHGAARRDGRRRSRPARARSRRRRRAAIRDWVDERREHALRDRLGRRARRRIPAIVRDLQRVIGDEARAQILERDGPPARARDRVRRRRLQRDRHLRRVRRRRRRRADRRRGRRARALESGRHGAPLTAAGAPGVLHGALLGGAAERGRPDPRGALDLGRARLPRRRARARVPARHRPRDATSRSTDDRGARRAARCRRLEGIIPALESAHALAWRAAPTPAATMDLV